MTVELLHGDCRDHMRAMEPNSVDAIVCDPPYGLEFMGKEWDRIGTGRKGNPFDPHAEKIGQADGTPFRQHTGTPSSLADLPLFAVAD